MARGLYTALRAGLLFLLVATGCRGARPAVEAPRTISLVRYAGELLAVTAAVGADSALFLFDTGGGLTLFTPEFAARVGCEPRGRIRAPRMTGELVEFRRCPAVALRIGSYTAPPMEIAVFDLMALLPPGLPPLGGLISLRSFAGRTVTLDWANRTITVETAASAAERAAGLAPLHMRMATGDDGSALTVLVEAGSSGGGAWLLLDSGNLAGTILSPPAAAELTGMPADSLAERVGVTLTLEGLGPIADSAGVRDLIYDGVLGTSFLKRGVFVLDLERGGMWGRLRP